MEIQKEIKDFKIGIDKISLYNFDVNMSESDEFYLYEDYEKGIKKEIIKNEWCSIVHAYYLTKDNKTKEIQEKNYKNITLNPNKILYGHNVGNSTPQELKKALEKLKEKLKEKNVYIDFSNAKIKDIEININIPKDFKEYTQVFKHLIRQTKKPQEIGAFIKTEIYKERIQTESLFGIIKKNTILRIYNKSLESGLDYPLSRIEFLIKKGALNYYLEKNKKENNLNVLFENPDIINNIFIEKITDIFKKARKDIQERIKGYLTREYLAFKSSGKLAREHNRTEKRGVYNYLVDNFIVFDYNILIEIVKEFNKKNASREIKIIKEKYSYLNNIEKLNYLIEFIYKFNK